MQRVQSIAPMIAGAVLAAVPACEARGLGDCEDAGQRQDYMFRAVRPPEPVPLPGEIVEFRFDGLPQIGSDGFASASIRIRASADLGLSDERLFIRIDGGLWTQVMFLEESDCADPANCTLVFPGNSAIIDSTLLVELTVSPSVGQAVCPNGFLEVGLRFGAEPESDCDGNRRDDACDILDGLLVDCNGNLWADACEVTRIDGADCNGNGILDCCEEKSGETDCDSNGRLDSCDIAIEPGLDCDRNGIRDDCDVHLNGAPDADGNGVPDACDIAEGRLSDCDGDGIPDITEIRDLGADADGDFIPDACGRPNADLFVDGVVNSADLAILLAVWGTADPRADLDRSGAVGATDLSALLTLWGPVGICGDGDLDPGENCCNCPEDAGCTPGFDCYYGNCLPCAGGICPPDRDACDLIYGPSSTFHPGSGQLCYGDVDFDCAYGALLDRRHASGFAMRVVSSDVTSPAVAMASLGLLLILATPKGLLRRLRSRDR